MGDDKEEPIEEGDDKKEEPDPEMMAKLMAAMGGGGGGEGGGMDMSALQAMLGNLLSTLKVITSQICCLERQAPSL